MKRTSFFILAAAMIISLCACSEKISCSGDISFSLPRTISSRSEAAGVNQEITVSNYNVTLSQENETIESENFKPETQIKFTDLTPGEYKITLKASMSDGSIYSGSKRVTVEAGKTAKCEIALYRDNENGEADTPPVSIEGLELPEGFFENLEYKVEFDAPASEGFSVVLNNDAPWYCDSTGPFILNSRIDNYTELFNAYLDGEFVDISSVELKDSNWATLGTHTAVITALNGEYKYETPVTIKAPVYNLSIHPGNKTITKENGMSFRFSSNLNGTINIQSENDVKIEDYCIFIYSYSVIDNQKQEISSGAYYINASKPEVFMTAEELGIKENGNYDVYIGVKEYSKEYGYLLYNPQVVTETIQIEVLSFTDTNE